VNIETEEESKQWMHTHSPAKPKKIKQTSARKPMATVFWDRKEVLKVGILATGDQNNVRSVLRNSRKLRRVLQNKMRGMLT
jgi:hypothetical protein